MMLDKVVAVVSLHHEHTLLMEGGEDSPASSHHKLRIANQQIQIFLGHILALQRSQ